MATVGGEWMPFLPAMAERYNNTKPGVVKMSPEEGIGAENNKVVRNISKGRQRIPESYLP